MEHSLVSIRSIMTEFDESPTSPTGIVWNMFLDMMGIRVHFIRARPAGKWWGPLVGLP